MRTDLPLLFAVVAATVFPANARAEDLRSGGQSTAPGQALVAEALGKLPLRFERNDGQTDRRVGFLSRGHGYQLFLTPKEVVLSLQRMNGRQESRGLGRRAANGTQMQVGAVLRMKFLGGKAKPEMTGVDELPGKSNYFVGDNPKRWRTSVPQYGRVVYQSLWRGVDLAFYGTNQGQLETDFTVAPGADPGAIRLAFDGARRVRLDKDGDLVLEVDAGEVIQQHPLVYQFVGGVRKVLGGSWALEGRNRVGFRVANYDRSRPLVIDPVIAFSTYLGGSGIDGGWGVAVDAAGNAYVTGLTYSTDFPTAGTPSQSTLRGTGDAFVTKLSPTSALIYSTYLGGTGYDSGYAIALDPAGNAYVAGETDSTDFPTAGTPPQGANAGYVDGFAAKLSPSSGLLYSTYFGGSDQDEVKGIAVDATANVYVTGYTSSTNFPTAGTPSQPAFGGGSDAFVAKLSPAFALVYSTYLGGTTMDFGFGIAVDAAGNAYVTGRTDSTDFPMAGTPSQPVFAGGSGGDAFVTKLDPTSSLVYSTYLGGSRYDSASGIAVDTAGNAHVTGRTDSTDFPAAGTPFQETLAGTADGFVTKLDSSSSLVYSTYLGGTGGEEPAAIAVDARTGDAYVTGDTSSTDFPTAGTPSQPTHGGGYTDAFVTKLSATSRLVFSTYLGGSSFDSGASIAMGRKGDVYVTGHTSSPNFPPAGTPSQPGHRGAGDVFLVRYGSDRTDFYTVTPCRLVDTRNTAGPTGGPALVANSTRSFPVTGGVCSIPSSAGAVSVNLTAVQPEAMGHLTLYPGNAIDAPLVSNINFVAGVTRANNAVVPLATDGTGAVKVKNGSAGAVHFVLDVNGYFQ